MIGILVAAMVAALLTAGVTPSVRRWVERKGAIDQPEARRVNKHPIPRAGGIAIVLGFLVAVILTVGVRQWRLPGQPVWTPQVTGVLLATAFIALTGLIDDFKNISARWQALCITASALILVAFGVRIEGVSNFFIGQSGVKYNPEIHWHALGIGASLFLTVLWVFIVTKTVDAIDGVDGLASGVCAISAATLALMSAQLRTPDGPTLALMAAAIVGACLGFLRHNYHPAKIIMGTIGAQTLGLALAAISIMGAFKVAAAVSVLIPILVLGVPIFDFTHVLARRLLDRAPLTVADKRHLHHRLLARGWNTKQVVWFIYSIAIFLCMTAFALFKAGRPPMP
jgi:UDP-GlcNAc:undecaprenyl-phosphate/decaprenyl-phosphate GlcNAc-1-phosphate transferase